jgi:hypothetical protein
MTWTADIGIRCDSLVAQIGTRLGAVWTAYDAANNVYSSVNNQGVTQYLQISQVGTYTYIQLQGWLSWNAGTHVGTSGSGATFSRLYLGSAAQGAAVLVNLYMSVTANRVIILIDAPATLYHTWGYFGGLNTLAGTADPNCVVLLTSYEGVSTNAFGRVLRDVLGLTLWPTMYWQTLSEYMRTADVAWTVGGSLTSQMILTTGSKFVIYPIMGHDINQTGLPSLSVRGGLDGLYFCPVIGDLLMHLDVLDVSSVNHLVFFPNGNAGVANSQPFTGNNYTEAMAIAET